MCVCVLLLTEIKDLDQVLCAISGVVRWTRLGLALGLKKFTLETIEREKMGRTEDCKIEMLSSWLRQMDDTLKEALPTWSALEAALRKIGEIKVANELSKC